MPFFLIVLSRKGKNPPLFVSGASPLLLIFSVLFGISLCGSLCLRERKVGIEE